MIRIWSLTCALAILPMTACMVFEHLDKVRSNSGDGGAGHAASGGAGAAGHPAGGGTGGGAGGAAGGGGAAGSAVGAAGRAAGGAAGSAGAAASGGAAGHGTGGGAAGAGGCAASCTGTQVCVSGGCASIVADRSELSVRTQCDGTVTNDVCDVCSGDGGFSAADAVTIGGAAGVTYDLVVEISGVFELVGYDGGTFGTTGNHLRDGGTVQDSDYNTVELDAGASRTYLNSLPDNSGPIGSVASISNLRKTLTLKSGDTMTLLMLSADCYQATTCDPTCLSQQLDAGNVDVQFATVKFVSASVHGGP